MGWLIFLESEYCDIPDFPVVFCLDEDTALEMFMSYIEEDLYEQFCWSCMNQEPAAALIGIDIKYTMYNIAKVSICGG